MRKSVESPEASQFPEKSKNLGQVLDTLAIRHTTDILISKFKNTFGYQLINEGHEFIGGEMDPEREIRYFLEAAKQSNNPFIVSEVIRAVYEMDGALINDNKLTKWVLDRIKIDELLENMFSSQVWISYVDVCDTKKSLQNPQSFCTYQQQRLWQRKGVLKDLLSKEYQKLLPAQNQQITDEESGEKDKTITAWDLRDVVEIILKLDDIQELVHLIELHHDTSVMNFRSSCISDYTFRRNIEKIIEKIYSISPETIIQMFQASQAENENSFDLNRRQEHIAVVTAFILKDWQSLFTIISETFLFSSYGTYKLELLAKLLNDEELNIPQESRLQIEAYLVKEIKQLSVENKDEVLRSFYHPKLAHEYFETIQYQLEQNYFDSDDLLTILSFLFRDISTSKRARILKLIRKKLTQQVQIEEAKTSDDDDDEPGPRRIQFTGEKVRFALNVGLLVQDMQIIEDCIELSFSKLGNHTFGATMAKETLLQVVPYAIEHGNRFLIDRLTNAAIDWYQQLESIALSEYLTIDVFELEYVVDGMEIMMKIFESLSTFRPEIVIEVGNEENPMIINHEIAIKRITEFYTWMHRGTQRFYEKFGVAHTSISESLSLASALLSHSSDLEIQLQVKMAIISESIRLHDMAQFTAASFYIRTVYDFLGSTWTDEESLLTYLSLPNLKWITDKLIPIANSARLSSQN